MDPSPPIVPPPRPGLALLFDAFVAPARAYATLAVRPQWWPAALIVVACIVAGNVLALPAEFHVLKTPRAPDLEIAVRIALEVLPVVVTWGFLASIFVSLAPSEKRRYSTYFALAVVGSLPAGLATVLEGLILRLHDPASFHSFAQIANALPVSLAIFTPNAEPREVAFLSSFDLFGAWKLLFIAFGARALGGIRPVVALVVGFSIDFAFALTQVLQLP